MLIITHTSSEPLLYLHLFKIDFSLVFIFTDDVDYGPIVPPNVYLRGGLSSTISQGIKSDSIAFEGEESYTLNLYLVRPTSLSSNEFVQGKLTVYISDRTSKLA